MSMDTATPPHSGMPGDWPGHIDGPLGSVNNVGTQQPPNQDHPGDHQGSPALPNGYISVNDYMTQPDFEAMFSTPKRASQPSINQAIGTADPPLAEPLGSEIFSGPADVAAVNQLCQVRGLKPEYTFVDKGTLMKPGFGVRIVVGDHVDLCDEGSWPTKKKAKEVVARKARELIEQIPLPGPSGGALKQENWIGKLTEHYQGKGIGPEFVEFTVGSGFSCEVLIPDRPGRPFGDRDRALPGKKLAKAAAAKLAWEWLIENYKLKTANVGGTDFSAATVGGRVPRTNFNVGSPGSSSGSGSGSGFGPGTGTAPSTSTANAANEGSSLVRVAGRTLEFRYAASWPQKVNDLATRLSLSAPEYRLVPSSPPSSSAGAENVPVLPPTAAAAAHTSMYTGAAHFAGSPDLPGPVGEVRHVLGLKRAREACAQRVWTRLVEMAGGRGWRVREVK